MMWTRTTFLPRPAAGSAGRRLLPRWTCAASPPPWATRSPQRRWHPLLRGVLEHVQRKLQRQAAPQGAATWLPRSSTHFSSLRPKHLPAAERKS